MGGQPSKRYGTLADKDKIWSAGWKLITQQKSYDSLILLRFRVFAPIDDFVKASARFEKQKLDEGLLRTLKKQFIENNSEGERVVLRCRDGTVAPHKEVLRCAWSGFLDGKSSFRVDFKEYGVRDIKNLVWFIYTNLLPIEENDLLRLLAVSHRLGYTSLSKAGSRELVDSCAELNEANVHSLVQHARRLELKYLYDRLCVVLARNFQRKTLMLSLDSDILRDVLSQDCLAVFSEDAVRQFIEEYAELNSGHVPLSFARCLRYKFLEEPASDKFAFKEIFQDPLAQPRESTKAYFMRAKAKVRYMSSTLTIRIKIELLTPDGKTKKLCAFKQHSNNLQKTKSSFEFPVAIVSCRQNYFVQLGKSVVQINPFTHVCYAVCHDVVKLDARESSVELITKFNQRIVLCEGPASVLKTFCIRSPLDVIEPTLVNDSDIDVLKGSASETALDIM